MKHLFAAALIATTLASPVSAGQPPSFEDQANLIGLDGYHHFVASQQPGRVVIDEDVYRDDGSSIRFTLMPGDCGPTYDNSSNDCEALNERVDLALSPWERRPEEFYTFSIRLDRNFADQRHRSDKSRWSDINLFQFKSANGTNSCFNLFYNYGLESLAVDNRCTDGVNYVHGERTVTNLELPELDHWYDLLIHVKWSNNTDGFWEIMEGGEQLFAYTGPTVIPSGDILSTRAHMFIYRYGREFYENTTPLTFWADNVGVYYSSNELPDRFR